MVPLISLLKAYDFVYAGCLLNLSLEALLIDSSGAMDQIMVGKLIHVLIGRANESHECFVESLSIWPKHSVQSTTYATYGCQNPISGDTCIFGVGPSIA